MNFLLTVCAAFLTYNHQVNYCHAVEFDLDTFMKNFEKSQTELKWIRDESHKNEGKDLEWADTKESNFDEDDESSVDHWYSKYRKLECSTNHGNEESKVLNGYCGVYDDSYQKPDHFVKLNNSKDPPVSNHLPKSNLKETKYEYPNTGSLFDRYDNSHEEMEQETFDLNGDTNLSPDEKLDLDEYNEQMIPNPNFYKINNEQHLNDQQINKDHASFRSDLGFSPGLSKSYPSSADDVFSPIENDYGIENRGKGQEIKRKRNTRDFGKVDKANFNQLPYDHLSDQDDTSKNNLSHEADYKLSKSEQESQDKPEPNTEFEFQRDHESDLEQSLSAEDKFGNEFTDENKPQNEMHSNFRNTQDSYNNFKEVRKPIPSFNKNSHVKAPNSKTNLFPKKQSPNSKPQKYLSKQGKSNQLANEINLKISNRMMSKGLGPSLPSQSVKYHPREYRHPMNVDVENQHWRQSREENNDYFTDYIGKQRHLLQFDYEDPVNADSLLADSYAPNEKSQLKNDVTQMLEGNPLSDNGEIPKSLMAESKENRNLTESETTPGNSTITIKIVPKTNSTQSESNITFQAGHVDSLNLQLELKISNATSKEQTTGDHGKIVKRSAPFGTPYGVQETKIQSISKNSSIRDLVSGKLPNQLIQAVFQLVKENNRLNKVIGSKLDMKALDNLELNSINLFKSKDKTEKMVKKLMTSITDLIDEQITHQTCITLPPDLQSFYDKVLYVRSINSRVNNMQKQEKSSANANKNSTKRIARSTIPESDIHQKYRTVGKLLKQFDHLKLRDQVKIFDIKEFLQNHIQLLDDLKTLNSEFVRKSRSVEDKNTGKVPGSEKGAKQISRQYANLLKTTKLIKTTSLTDMDRLDVISTY